MKDLFKINYEVMYEGKYRKVENVGFGVILQNKKFAYFDYSTGCSMCYELKDIRNLKIIQL